MCEVWLVHRRSLGAGLTALHYPPEEVTQDCDITSEAGADENNKPVGLNSFDIRISAGVI